MANFSAITPPSDTKTPLDNAAHPTGIMEDLTTSKSGATKKVPATPPAVVDPVAKHARADSVPEAGTTQPAIKKARMDDGASSPLVTVNGDSAVHLYSDIRPQEPGTTTPVSSSDESVSSLSAIVQKGFRFAPPEVRAIIFAHHFNYVDFNYLHFSEIPALILALENDKVLYGEALEAYSKACTFRICWEDEGTREIMPYDIIKKLEIRVNFDRTWDGRFFPSSGLVRKLLANTSSIIHLSLDIPRTHGGENNRSKYELISSCLENFSNLKRFSLSLGRSQESFLYVHKEVCSEYFDYNAMGNRFPPKSENYVPAPCNCNRTRYPRPAVDGNGTYSRWHPNYIEENTALLISWNLKNSFEDNRGPFETLLGGIDKCFGFTGQYKGCERAFQNAHTFVWEAKCEEVLAWSTTALGDDHWE